MSTPKQATRAVFSLLKASEGGRTFADAKRALEAEGVTDVRREYSPYIGHFGLSVPRRFYARALRALFP